MELSTQLIGNINNLSDDDKKLLVDLINRMNKKTENSSIPALTENNPMIKVLGTAKFPISNTFLEKESDYTKNLYFQCLAVALASIQDKNNALLYLFNRLFTGANIEGDIEFYLKKAYSLEKEQLYDFFEEIKSKELKFRFIIDFIVLLGSSGLKKESLYIVANFCEALEIEIDEVKLLFDIAMSILTQDTDLYWKLVTQNKNNINLNIANDYMKIEKIKAEKIYKKASDLFRMFKFKEALPLLHQLAISEYPESFALLYWIYCDGNYEDVYEDIYEDIYEDVYEDVYIDDYYPEMKFLKKGYELGDTVTTVLYALFYAKDNDLLKQTLPKLEKLAKEGNVFAEYTLGLVDISNLLDSQDYYLAMKHFIKAHGMGFYRASISIFLRYKNGEGVFTKNWVQASLWAEETLKWGIEYKGFDVAYTYMTIEEYGCDDSKIQNDFYKKAISLWKKLVDNGLGLAATNLAWMYMNGRGVEESVEEAFKYYKIAADRGDDIGQTALAIFYEEGVETEKDINKAIFWYKKAAEQDNEEAKDALERLGIKL